MWRDGSPVIFVSYFIYLGSERLVYPFWKRRQSVGEKSSTAAAALISRAYTKRHQRELMEMGIEVDYRDRTALRRE